jgi:hypothetical protein
VDVRIGVTYSPREIELQMADDTDRAELKARVEAVLGSGEGVLWIEDRKGREVGVPAGKIAYVEMGSATEARAMGFSS